MRPKYPEIGKRIAEARKALGLKQKDCLKPLGDITIQMLSNWENGHTFPTATYLMKIAKVFNVSLDYIILGVRTDTKGLEVKTYKEAMDCIYALKESNVFNFMQSAIQRGENRGIYFFTENKEIVQFYLDLQKVESAKDFMTETAFKQSIEQIKNKFDYKIRKEDPGEPIRSLGVDHNR